jgi:large conductance mechanosensitive channel
MMDGESAITYGKFLNALVSFLIVAFVMFVVVKAYNRMAGPKDAITRPCLYCKTDIPLDATRCPNCTSQLEGVAAQKSLGRSERSSSWAP